MTSVGGNVQVESTLVVLHAVELGGVINTLSSISRLEVPQVDVRVALYEDHFYHLIKPVLRNFSTVRVEELELNHEQNELHIRSDFEISKSGIEFMLRSEYAISFAFTRPQSNLPRGTKRRIRSFARLVNSFSTLVGYEALDQAYPAAMFHNAGGVKRVSELPVQLLTVGRSSRYRMVETRPA